MYKSLLSLILILMGSTTLLARTAPSYPDFKLELGLSPIEYLYTLTAPFEKSNETPSDGLCGEIHLLYNFKEGQNFSVGINFYNHLSSFSIPIPTNDAPYSEEQWEDSYEVNIFAFPVSYTIDKRLSPKILTFLEGGLCLNFPIQKNDLTTGSNYLGSSTNSTFITSNPKGLTMTSFFKLGIKTTNRKGYYFKISGVANLPINPSTIATYNYGETHPDYPTKGTISSAYGYYGISLNFVFSLKNAGNKIVKIRDKANNSMDEWFETNGSIISY